jgi:hypothetical protein
MYDLPGQLSRMSRRKEGQGAHARRLRLRRSVPGEEATISDIRSGREDDTKADQRSGDRTFSDRSFLCAFHKGQITDDYPLVLGIVIDAQVMGKPGTEGPRDTVRILLKPKMIGVARGKIVAKNVIPALTHYTDPPVCRNHRWIEGVQISRDARADYAWLIVHTFLKRKGVVHKARHRRLGMRRSKVKTSKLAAAEA